MREAMFYEKTDGATVRCFLCAHRCVIGEGKRGICAVRENRGGTLYSLVYGRIAAINVDPIEKKPLYHFLPGSLSYSIATVGCNFRCEHCQNYEISQFPRERPDVGIPGKEMTPEAVVSAAIQAGCRSISYTYTEPTIFLEFALDCAMLARQSGIRNVFVSNGFMTAESAGAIAPYLDANNIDLKGDERFYREICHARAAPVRETIKLMKEKGVWVEITTLIIPGHNDSAEVLRDIARFIRSVDPFIPWHISQFYPAYRLLDSPPTPVETLKRAREIGFDEGLKHVYLGNVPGEGGEDTCCPFCGAVVVARSGFRILDMRLQGKGVCPSCSREIKGIWEIFP
ncbi:MAG: AmmeMemoRadiSam system radical SAM enzyme [Nitrospiraceae bacterium]|nr:AmmeMemoRadiSam system radical SAM enzyme [Nitrospiraceae bacterium]